jgi:Tol biopolymer transport system component
VVIAHGVEAGEVIYVLDVTRGQITPLIKDLKTAAFGSPGQFLSWHPSSNEVLYKTTNGSEPGLWRVDIHTGERYIVVQPIPPDGISGGAVSPDGQTIVYAWYRSIEHPGQIWMVDVDGSNPRLIAEGGTYYVFSWSPNSDYLVYTGEPSENEGTPSSGSPLWIMDASGQNRRRLQGPFIFGWGFIPVWSPDGHKLAYVGTSADEPFGEKPIPSNVGELDEWLLRGTSIYVEDIVNGEVQRLSQGIDPTWSPDGTRIVFVSNQSGSPEIWMTNADGTELRQLTEEGKPIRYPTWLQR